MGKALLIYQLLLFSFIFSFGQKVAVSADKNNILYLEVDNPLTIAVENTSCKELVVKTDNGEITGQNGSYAIRPKSIGIANISISIKQNGKLRHIAKRTFRVKYFTDESNVEFYIGNCSDNCTISKSLLENQHFVRAVVVKSDMDARLPIDSFGVEIFSHDTVKMKHNIGDEINQDLKSEFTLLNDKDILVFKNIYCHRLDGTIIQLNPIKIFVSE